MLSFKEYSPQGRIFINLPPSFPGARKELFHFTKSWQKYGFVMQNLVHSAKNMFHLQNIPSYLDYIKPIVLPFTKHFNLFDVTPF